MAHANTLRIVAWACYCTAHLAFLLLPLLARDVFLDENAFVFGGAPSEIIKYFWGGLNTTCTWVHKPQMPISNRSTPKDAWTDTVQALYTIASDRNTPPKQILNKVHLFMQRANLAPSLHNLDHTVSTLHGVLSSRDGREAILLVTPIGDFDLKASSSSGWQQGPHARGLTVAIAAMLIEHLARAPWRAKDIIWVVVNAEEVPVVDAVQVCVVVGKGSHVGGLLWWYDNVFYTRKATLCVHYWECNIVCPLGMQHCVHSLKTPSLYI